MKKIIQTICLSLAVAFSQSASAEALQELILIKRVFPEIKLQDCSLFSKNERSECHFSQLRLGYFSWGLVFASEGYHVSFKTRPDLGEFRIFPLFNIEYVDLEEGALAFLQQKIDICDVGQCEKYFGLSRDALNKISGIYDETRLTILCLSTRDVTRDALGGREFSHRDIVMDDELIHAGLIPTCPKRSDDSHVMLRRALLGR